MTPVLRQRSLVLAAFLAALLLGGCSPEQSSMKHFEQAREHYAKGDRKSAVIELKNALQQNPANAEARLLLGTIYNDTGLPAPAEKELRRAQQLRVQPDEVAFQLGRALNALAQYQKVLDEVPAPAGSSGQAVAALLSVRGDAYLGLGKLESATASYESALQASAEFPDALTGLAKLRLMNRDVAGGRDLIERALAKSSRAVEAWVMKADLLRFDGKYDEAIAAYGEALKVAPFNLGARMSRTALYLRQGKSAEAQQEVEAMRAVAPNHPIVRYVQALVHYGAGQYAQAEEALQFALRTAPDYAPARLLLGTVNVSMHNYRQGDQILSRFLQDFPSSVIARRVLGVALIRSGQAKRALETVKPLLEAAPNDPEVLGLVGEAYLLAGDQAKASEYLERGISMDPGSAGLRTSLAMVHLRGGEVDRAIDELALASAADPGAGAADFALAGALLRSKRYEEAIAALEDLQKKLPKSPVPHDLTAVAYLGKGDRASARRSLERALELDPTHVSAAVRLAVVDAEDGQPDKARKRIEAMLAKDPKNVRLMAAMAQIAQYTGDGAGFASWMEKARAADASSIQPRLILAKHYLARNDADAAMPVVREILALQPKSAEALDLLGLCFELSGQTREALDTYRQLVAVAPRSAAAHLRLGAMQAREGERAAAESTLRRALELRPDALEVKSALAMLLADSGKVDDALKLARQAQKEHPDSAVGFGVEGDILSKQKRWKEAAMAYQAGLAVKATSAMTLRLYLAQSRAGDKPGAETRLKDWVGKHPEDLQARLYLADAYAQTGRPEEAIAEYRVVLQGSPNNVVVLNNLANLLHERKDPQALAMAEKAYNLVRANPVVADTYGWLLVESGQVDKGLGVLREALRAAPDQPDLRYHAAAALARSGDRTKARQELEALLKTGKRFQQAEEARALLQELSR